MKTLATTCLILSLFITAYCFFERELPHAQYTKVLSDLKTAGITDQQIIEQIRWSIVGARTTWPPLLVLVIIQNVLLLVLVARLLPPLHKIQDLTHHADYSSRTNSD